MFTQKLLLAWGDGTVLDAVLQHWTESLVERVVLVCRAEPEVLAIGGRWGVDIVQIENPPHMKDSILAGLDWVSDQYRPGPGDGWMLAPADMPRIEPSLIAQVAATGLGIRETGEVGPAKAETARVEAKTEGGELRIALPRVGRHRGHPVFFPWSEAAKVAALSEDEGVNVLVRDAKPRLLDCSDQGALLDLDTPEQYARARPNTRR